MLILIAASDLILILINYLRNLQLPITDGCKAIIPYIILVTGIKLRSNILYYMQRMSSL
jgi:hypothetical protein